VPENIQCLSTFRTATNIHCSNRDVNFWQWQHCVHHFIFRYRKLLETILKKPSSNLVEGLKLFVEACEYITAPCQLHIYLGLYALVGNVHPSIVVDRLFPSVTVVLFQQW